MNKKGFYILLTLGLLMFLAACSTTETAVTPEAVATDEVVPEEVEIAEVEEETAVSTETITITDFDGREVEVPANPQRIIALSEKDIDAAVALGMPLVGVVNGRGSAVAPTYLEGQLGNAISVGSFTEPSLETILELEPDLILIGGIFPGTAGLVDPLSEIAPTVVTYGLEDNWQDSFIKSAAAMNRAAEAQAWLDETYASRVTEISDALGDTADSTVGIVRFNPDGPVIMALDSFASLIAQDLGLVRPETQQIEGFSHSDTLSLEQIQDIDADYLFISSLNPEGAATLETALAEPLYQSLTAVSEDHTTIVNGAAWTSVGGPLAAMQVLEDIAAALGEESAGTMEEETAVTDSTFPITIEHAFGSTTIETTPERIISIGYADQDPLIALGAPLIAGRYWFGDTESIVFPWAADDLQGEEPEVLNMAFGALNFETILSLDPDLIIAVSSGIMEDEYELLSEIAPTIAQGGEYDNFGMPWHEATQSIGDAVGKSAEAEALIADVQSVFSDAAAAHPEFAGKEIVVAGIRSDGGDYFFFSAQDARTRFFTDLGFVAPADLDELTGESFYTDISGERVELLDRDFIVFSQASYLPEGADTILNDPLLAQLDAIKEGRFIILSEEIDGAFSVSSVLSLPYAVEELVPQLADALAQ